MTATASSQPVTRMSRDEHPCFDENARLRTARVHLPVAPKCNVQCNYCNRKSDCVSESRPGVSSTVLSPEQAADYVDAVRRDVPNLAVVGIAGPGDPFANAEKTLTTLRLVKERHPDLLLCVSSNGLNVPPYLDELAELEVSHVTITLNTVDPEVGGQVYRWVRDEANGKQIYRGTAAGELILARQLESIAGLKARGITVKVNTILVPGVTLDGIEAVARKLAELGVDTMNCLPLYPVEGTPFGELPAPDHMQISTARKVAEQFVEQMTHCSRCRADAVGMLGEEHTDDAIARLLASRSPAKDRPYIAVCSQEGFLVNQHLGGADRVLVYADSGSVTGAGGPLGQLVETRTTPPSGGGARRWSALAALVSDCRVLLCHQLGATPRMVLERSGLTVYETDGLISDAVTDVLAGRPPRKALAPRDCNTGSCEGSGTGCG